MKSVAPKTVDEYIAGVPEPARTTLSKVCAAIRSAVPTEATEAISYRIPIFKYKGMLVGFAAFSHHCSLFVMGSSVMEAFKKQTEETSPPPRLPSASLWTSLFRPLLRKKTGEGADRGKRTQTYSPTPRETITPSPSSRSRTARAISTACGVSP